MVNEESPRLPQVADLNTFLPDASITPDVFQSEEPGNCTRLIPNEDSSESRRPVNTQTRTPDSHHQASTYPTRPTDSVRAYGFNSLTNSATRARSIDHVNLSPEQVNALFRMLVSHSIDRLCCCDTLAKAVPDTSTTTTQSFVYWTRQFLLMSTLRAHLSCFGP